MRFHMRFHTYELLFAALAAGGGSASDSFQVETAFDFHWLKAQAFIYDANGLGVSTLQWPNVEVLLQDGATAQQLSNRAASIPALFGTGQIPYILPKPHRIGAGATFNATAKNLHAANAYSVRLLFSGIHVKAGTPLVANRRRRAS